MIVMPLMTADRNLQSKQKSARVENSVSASEKRNIKRQVDPSDFVSI